MTALRSSGQAAERQKTHSTSSSSLPGASPSAGGAWVSPKRTGSSGGSPGDHFSPNSATASPVLGSFSSLGRSSTAATSPSPSYPVPTIVAGMSPSAGSGAGAGVSTGSSMASSNSNTQKQPLNMEALAAKFADSKEAKEKFATLQLSPALTPATLPDKERRAPAGSLTPSSSATSHMAHIKVQRTASLNHNAHPGALSKGGRLQPGHLAQPTDMRRTASHNNAFSSGLGLPVGSVNSGFEQGAHAVNAGAHNGNANVVQTHNAHGGGALGGASGLAPFSLGQMARSPRRSSLNPRDSGSHHDHNSSSPSSLPSPLVGDKHPLQHPWTLYYDITTGYSRQSSSLNNYENGLRDLGTFTTVELFARYFNWIEKPHRMEISANYHLFKGGIKPMWEDPANANGGRWIITLLSKNTELLDRCWMELAYALVGEQLDVGDDICGAVLSRRTKADRLAVWVRDSENVEAINGIGLRLIRILDLAKEKITMEFQVTTDVKTIDTPKNYISLEAIRKELAQEAMVNTPAPSTVSECDMTPSLSVDSVPATPVPNADASPATPVDMDTNGAAALTGGREKQQASVGTSGLLISVEGREVFGASCETE
ncbi:hypothetical protein BGZ70_007126 [Mortierella alpina]|uniref:Uncharacterized protein n=1 Tax=Mortierella alpina TaxID=64518 RepID=A0A9P6JE21_MORAP|nr:hypothetical protein BGZ70_007126 [Mortierella alpina]